jgi:transposase
MQVYDELTMLFDDRGFVDLFPIQGQPAKSPTRLALVTLLQFMEGLTDRQAADAVRTRIDWKYLLCMELADAGFHHTVLSEFCTRLLTHEAERRLFETVLDCARSHGLLKAGGRQRSDSAAVPEHRDIRERDGSLRACERGTRRLQLGAAAQFLGMSHTGRVPGTLWARRGRSGVRPDASGSRAWRLSS